MKSDLLKEGMDESVEEIRRKANRMDELYLKSSGPTTPGRERFGGLSVEEWDEAQSMYRLICYALKVYGDDLSQTKDSIITRVRTRKTDDEDLKRFLKFDEVDRQLDGKRE